MLRSIRSLLVFLALAPVAIGSAAAEPPLAGFSAEYDVRRNGSKLGIARLTLAHDAAVVGRAGHAQDTWTYTTHTEGTAGLAAVAGVSIREVSRFRWVGGRMELVESSYDQKAAWKKKQRRLVCDAAAGTIASTDGDREVSLRFEPNVLDRHLSMLALAVDLGAEREALSYRVAHRGELKTDRYESLGTEAVEVPAGRYDAAKLELARDKPGRSTTVWAAAATGYLPVRILQREPDGETLELRLLEAPKH